MQANAKKKFDETVEAHVVLTPDMRRSDLVHAFVLFLAHIKFTTRACYHSIHDISTERFPFTTSIFIGLYVNLFIRW